MSDDEIPDNAKLAVVTVLCIPPAGAASVELPDEMTPADYLLIGLVLHEVAEDLLGKAEALRGVRN